MSNMGHLSEFFDCTRGVHQGCPIAPYLFLVVAQFLFQLIQRNGHIRGITIGDSIELKSLQYADDTKMTLLQDPYSICHLLLELQYFREKTGLSANLQKTEYLLVGDAILSQDLPFTKVESTKILGTWVTAAGRDHCREWEGCVAKAKERIDLWSLRTFSLLGNVLLVNSLIGSLFVYLMYNSMPMPANIRKELQNLIDQRVTKNKSGRIRALLHGPKCHGGAALVDLHKREKAIKLSWVHTLLTNSVLEALNCDLFPEIGDSFWECNLAVADCFLFFKPSFWRVVVEYWCELHFRCKSGEPAPLDEWLWFNSDIRIGGAPVFWVGWWRRGIRYVRDLLKWCNSCLCFKTLSEFSQEFDLGEATIFVQFHALTSSLKRTYKMCEITQGDFEHESLEVEGLTREVLDGTLTVRSIYQKLISNEDLLISTAIQIRDSFGVDVYDDDLIRSISGVYMLTNCVRLRSFHFLFMYQMLYFNDRLFHMKVVSSSDCTFCDDAIERFAHLFWECPVTRDFYAQVWLMMKLPLSTMSARTVLLNEFQTQELPTLFRFFVLLAKYFVYQSRLRKRKPRLKQFENFIIDIYKTESAIASASERTEKHYKKWDCALFDLPLYSRIHGCS